VVVIRYHWDFPGQNDPFYLANPTENDARIENFYGSNYVPRGFIDGIDYTSNHGTWAGGVSSRLNVPSPITIELTPELTGETGSVHIVIEVEEPVASGFVYLYTGFIETGIWYAGEDWDQVFRDFFPTSSGTSIDLSETGSYEYDIPFEIWGDWDLANCELFVFAQDLVTHEVFQAARSSIPMDTPALSYVSHEIVADDNGDGRPDPGETCDMEITIFNDPRFMDAPNITGTLLTDDPDVTLLQAETTFPDCVAGEEVTCETPFQFEVSPDLQPHKVWFVLETVADTFDVVFADSFQVIMGRPQLLLVDDDSEWFIEFYQSSLVELGVPHDDWDVNAEQLTLDELSNYELVIWETGRDQETLDLEDQELLSTFCSAGGNLMLCSQYAGEDIGETEFFGDILHAEHTVDNVNLHFLDGVAGHPCSEGLSLLLTGYAGGNDSESPSGVSPLTGAEACFAYQNSEEYGAVSWEGEGYKTLYCAFAFEAIGGLVNTNTREEVLGTILGWFEIEGETVAPVVLPEQVLLLSAWPNPFNPTVTLSWELPQAAAVDLTVFNLLGERVALLPAGNLPAGNHQLTWDAAAQAAGPYFIDLRAVATGGRSYRATQRVTLVK